MNENKSQYYIYLYYMMLRLLRTRSCCNSGYPDDCIDYDNVWFTRFSTKDAFEYCVRTLLTPIFFDYRKIWSKRAIRELKRSRTLVMRLRRCVRARRHQLIQRESNQLWYLFSVSRRHALMHRAIYQVCKAWTV